MSSDALHRRCVAALWRLVETTRAGSEAAVASAVAQATAAVREAMGQEPFLIVHERGGALHVDGRALAVDADLFQPARGLAAAMQRHGVGETLFDQGVAEADLRAWAVAFARGDAPPAEVERVHSAVRTAQAAPALPLRRLASGAAADSRLRAVYVQHRLLEAVGDSAGPAPLVRSALHGLVERLLELDRGLEPLAELQRRPGALALGLRRAVAAIVLGRVAGLADRSLATLGIAALGTAVQLAAQPAGTGDAGFWIRCSAIADEALAAPEPQGTTAGRLVRLAIAVAAGEATPPGAAPAWQALAEAAHAALGLPVAG
jgi:hypothetical protein